MLGVFQHVVQQIEEKDQNAFVSFDLLFEGIRSTIRGELQSAIILAERQLDKGAESTIHGKIFQQFQNYCKEYIHTDDR